MNEKEAIEAIKAAVECFCTITYRESKARYNVFKEDANLNEPHKGNVQEVINRLKKVIEDV